MVCTADARCGGLGCSRPFSSSVSSPKSSMGAESGAIAATTDATEGSRGNEAEEAMEEAEAAPPKYFGTLRGMLPSWLTTWW